MAERGNIITLTTDFGTGDAYVAMMKGVILGIAPNVMLVDITHQVPPQDIFAAAILLDGTVKCYPVSTIHVAVVDPGVGSARAAAAIRTQSGRLLVGPDNGVFSSILEDDPPIDAVNLDNPAYHRQPVSSTFHGRDIFAPAAAHLANGVDFGDLGSPIDELVRLELPGPVPRGSGLDLHVIAVDRFGNVMTDLTREHYEKWRDDMSDDDIGFRLRGAEFFGLQRTYGDVAGSQPVAYFGSSERLEIGIRGGSASSAFQLEPGELIQVIKRTNGNGR
jgi:S-adenosylmethionine hydrolase